MTHDPIENAEHLKELELKAYNIAEFLKLAIEPKEDILTPILQTQSLSMLFAKRGIGKTHIALNIGYAIASGGKFLKWEAPKARKVLVLDGEMPAITMQERLAQIVQENEKQPEPEYFTLLTPDMQEYGMPDISTLEGQNALLPYVKEADFIIVDNISTLARTGKENEAEGWLPIQQWALELRSIGKSVMFVHHAGKGGQQRGTSRREDVLDLVMELKHPEDYQSNEGARFEVHFTKARHIFGDDSEAFQARLMSGGWSFMSIENADLKRVLDLKKEGLNFRQIAKETGISKSKAQRLAAQNAE